MVEMYAFYSISNKDLTLYSKKTGLCIARLINFNIYDIMRRYNIEDRDLHITL